MFTAKLGVHRPLIRVKTTSIDRRTPQLDGQYHPRGDEKGTASYSSLGVICPRMTFGNFSRSGLIETSIQVSCAPALVENSKPAGITAVRLALFVPLLFLDAPNFSDPITTVVVTLVRLGNDLFSPSS